MLTHSKTKIDVFYEQTAGSHIGLICVNVASKTCSENESLAVIGLSFSGLFQLIAHAFEIGNKWIFMAVTVA